MKKLLLLIFGSFLVFGSIAQEAKTELKTRFDVIRNETVKGANTTVRIADAYQKLADASQSIYFLEAAGSGSTDPDSIDTYTGSSGSVLNITSYAGKWFIVQFLATNGKSPVYLNINSIGSKEVKNNGSDLGLADIDSLDVHIVAWDAVNDYFQILTLSSSGTVSSIATTSPITGGTITTTGTIGITQSTTSTDGYLSSTDWNTFNGKQASDADLTTIAGLSPSNDDFLQRKAGAWTNRTVDQVKSDLSLSGSNTGDQTITLTGDVTGTGTGSFATTIKTDVALAGSPTTTTQSPDDNSTNISTTAYADAKVEDAIVNGVTTIAPSQNIIFDELALKSPLYPGLLTYTSSHTATASTDIGKTIEMSSASALNFTITSNSLQDFPINTYLTVTETGTGGLTFVAAGTATITPPAGGNLLGPGKGLPSVIWQRAIDDWVLWNGVPPPVTDLTTDVTGVLPIANGGTGQATANDAFNALIPSQIGNSGKLLTTNGTNTSWTVAGSGWNLDGNTLGSEKWIGTADAFSFPIRTNNIERFKFDSNGNVTGSQTAQSSTNTFFGLTQSAHTGGSPIGLSFTAGAHTTLANAISNGFYYNGSRTKQFGQNTILAFDADVTYDFSNYVVSSSAATKTITTEVAFQIKGSPSAGTNATLTNFYPFAVTNSSNTVQAALVNVNTNFGSLILGSVSRASGPSIGPMASNGAFDDTGANMKFQTGTLATNGRVGYSFTTSAGTILQNSSDFISASPTLGGSTSVTTEQKLFRAGPTINPTNGTSLTIGMFVSDPTINVGASVTTAPIAGFVHKPTLTALNNAVNYAFISNSGAWGNGTLTPTYQYQITGTAANQNLLLVEEDGGANVIEAKESGGVNQLGFFAATPVAKPAAITDLGTVLSDLGLRTAGTAYTLTTTGNISTGNVTLGTAGNKLVITEGTDGRVGQTTLVAGTQTITINGLTTNSRAFVTLVTPTGVTLTTAYQAVCTSNTLTIQANVAAGTINTADGSVLNYFVIN